MVTGTARYRIRAVSYTHLDVYKRQIMDNGWYSIITSPYSNVLKNMNWLYLAFVVIIGLFLVMVAAMTWRDIRTNALSLIHISGSGSRCWYARCRRLPSTPPGR